MDRNFFLACVLSITVLMGWIMFTNDVRKTVPAGQESLPESESVQEPLPAPAPSAELARALPDAPLPPAIPGAVSTEEAEPERRIAIEMPLYSAELSNRGAGITSWTLKEFRELPDPASPLIELITGKDPHRTSVVTPFHELGLGDLSDRTFRVVAEDFSAVVFETSERGITVRKTFTFNPESYSFRVLLEVDNQSTVPVAPRFQVDFPAHIKDAPDFREEALAALEDGSTVSETIPSLGKGGFLGSLTGKKAEPYRDYTGDIDWAGVQTTYFLAALLPDSPSQADVRMATLEPGVSGATRIFFDPIAIPPGQSAARELRGYMGPKEIERLESLGGETIRAIDLGWSWVQPLTRFFSFLLAALYSIIPNYGVAIIILTILVRVVTAPLTIKQMRSMERMRALSPKLKELQAKYADDRKKQSEQTMALYKSEGVNPLGGCLPMILQFPVFIGLFYALRSAIELRQSPFFGWIVDLSAPETLFEIPGIGLPVRVLPLIMGATMVLQQRITPMQVDPAQAKMMMTVMPVMMTFVFYQFPSGLVLYWMVSNVLAIAHQLMIGRGMRAKVAS
jgi:YidC/Oxa1 family membrane protein insertase